MALRPYLRIGRRMSKKLNGVMPWRLYGLRRRGERFVVNYSEKGDARLTLWPCDGENDSDVVLVYDRHFEYAYVIEMLRKHDVRDKDILDVGSSGSVLPTMLAALGNRVLCIDVRAWPVTYPNLKVIRGEVLEVDIPNGSVDVITCISTAEHFGLGRYGDREDVDGDVKGVARIKRWLRRNGLMILSVPYGRASVAFPAHRVYDESRLARMISGLRVLEKKFFGPIEQAEIYRPCSEEETHSIDTSRSYAIVCCLLQKQN